MRRALLALFLLIFPTALCAQDNIGADVVPVKGKTTIVQGETFKFTTSIAVGRNDLGFVLDKVDVGVEFAVIVQVTDDGVNFTELCRGAGVGKGLLVTISCGDRFTNKMTTARQLQGTLTVTKGTTLTAIDAVTK